MWQPPPPPAEIVADLTRVILAVAPELPVSAAAWIAVRTNRRPAVRTRLAEELRGRPDLLTSGWSGLSPSAVALIVMLQAHGATGVRVPGCSACGARRLLTHRDGTGGKRCGPCNRRASERPCEGCGRSASGSYRVLDGVVFCVPCARRDGRTHETCSRCGARAAPATRNGPGVLCQRCYSAPPVSCGRCGQQRPAVARSEGGPLCNACYRALQTRPRSCAGCGAHRLTPHFRPGGAVCSACAPDKPAKRCAGCGADEYPMLGSRCMRCEAPRKLRAVISDRNGRPHPQLLPLEEFLLRDPARSEAVVKWATRGSMARTIRQMANGERPVSLRTIAEEPATAGSGYVAALLMEAGVLPTANFERVRLEVWQESFLASIADPAHRRLLRRYAQWAVNPLFDGAAHLAVSDQGHRFSRSRQHLRTVRDLLEAAAEIGCGLDTLPQQAFDEYVVTHGAAGRELTTFIRWARRNRLTTLRSHYAQARYATPVVSDDERWDWVKQLLAAEDVMLSSRVGGLLSITYGIPVTRVLTLRRDAVHNHGDQVQLTLSKDPVTLPQRIGDLLLRLLQEPAVSPVREDIWVFRGRRPGRHLSPAALTKPLLARGIRVGHARSAALLNLARDAPPSVLADLLGISISSAERWGKLAAHDWIDYPLLRDLSAEQSGHSEPSRA